MAVGREVAISLDGVRDKNVMLLKKLNTAIFPVCYNEKYYADALASDEFTKLAYYSDICVGLIACRMEKKEGGAICVYIMTLGVLAPYRGLGTGTKLLNHVLELCLKEMILYTAQSGSNKRVSLNCINVLSPRQSGGTEYGYYVCLYFLELVVRAYSAFFYHLVMDGDMGTTLGTTWTDVVVSRRSSQQQFLKDLLIVPSGKWTSRVALGDLFKV
ncbi:N-alpha-acetyltransferase 50 [Hibiscus syriacus]|uniref:N-alpha-acetyltransferase 50 n=1 Tax=Hibiscus syriacus TaxID=106335 RepID=A0A6A3CUL1_HIBSY|nr:N-alpha-acetyltransferase 50 [Hibiscus syriacus]